MRLTIRKGDSPDATAINEEVKRIWDMGYFSDVQATLEGNVLVFTVVEKPRIDNIVVDGSDKVSKDDVLAAMPTAGLPMTPFFVRPSCTPRGLKTTKGHWPCLSASKPSTPREI